MSRCDEKRASSQVSETTTTLSLSTAWRHRESSRDDCFSPKLWAACTCWCSSSSTEIKLPGIPSAWLASRTNFCSTSSRLSSGLRSGFSACARRSSSPVRLISMHPSAPAWFRCEIRKKKMYGNGPALKEITAKGKKINALICHAF